MQPNARRALPLAALALAVAAGCQGYTYTLNEREVFTPPGLFTDYAIEDRALADCVQQAIEDTRAATAADLRSLNCSSAGITALGGLEVFTGLQRLGLDGNAIASVAPLAGMRELELLQLRGNRLKGYEPALCGKPGRRLALAGNAAFRCEDLGRLRDCGAVLEDVPAHCADPG